MQGQSVFGASGDTGAFGCIRSDGTTGLAVIDPPSQPLVTSVGGTSLESFNPGHNQHPRYPAGVESVWNTDALCSDDAPGPATTTRAASSGAPGPAPAAAVRACSGAGRSTSAARA